MTQGSGKNTNMLNSGCSEATNTNATLNCTDQSNCHIPNVCVTQSTNKMTATTVVSNYRRAYISVAILCFINLINYMDRYTIAGVLTDVKAYYALSNSEAGLLQTSFIVSYMIMAPIFGYLGDRYNRRWIMAGGIMFWSATTFLGSLVPSAELALQFDFFLLHTFYVNVTGLTHLFYDFSGLGGFFDAYFRWFILLRALVGTGEASYSTIAPTIIADLFAGPSRTKMLSLFFFAIPVGSGLGYIISAQVANLFGHWYWALRITPGLGVVSVILLMVLLVEPPRGESDGSCGLKNTAIMDDIIQVVKIPSFMWVTLGFTCVTFSVGALAWWVPDFIVSAIKVNGGIPDKAAVSLVFGVITCFAGIFGVILGSGSAALYRKVNPKADPLICFYSMLAAVPFVYTACLVSENHVIITYVLIFFGITLLCMNWVLVTDITLYVVIPTRRSIAAAIQITISHALGDACSPYVVGTISDAIDKVKSSAADEYRSMQYALFLPVFMLVIGAACFLINSLYVVEDKDRCTRFTKGHNPTIQMLNSAPRLPIDQNNSLEEFSSDTVNLIS